MSVDPIADMLTRIRNAHTALHREVKMPSSKAKKAILEIMADKGFIQDFKSDGRTIQVRLKYYGSRPVIKGLNKISKPGRKVYSQAAEIPLVRNGLGICIVSTSRGVMDGMEARKQNVGGELICEVW
ncbi:ribosomal protein S8 [Desulfonatronospira thiodismutans ASO3-1]|uniref:Small ribosomal subunit protein uS8 n=1 Tax=Desulfonatronospira thiodismutans ASO3-1 TaxID=555779 RepID=D6SUL9_9BACT|nr:MULTISPECIES: 30S ribosomal protein S8 [Desulfonatronospira]EFI32999.1 ribosomal protein S8 [Desulfonatronospira thiodismutans ASO3-1]RQD74564.1 MAG: 30S ribosomal protein S8 [Desulfonatronospira sp. MSAO_Bac3]